jgi:hypothetical protein
VPSVKVSGKIGRGEGADALVSVPVVYDSAKADVGDLAKATAAADTPHRDSRGAPSATLVLPAPKMTAANAKKVVDALKGLKGVDAAASRADLAKKEIHVKLDDQGGAKLADIEKALADFRK